VKLFADALGDVPLTSAQRAAVEQLATDAEARHAAARAAHKDLMLTFAAEVQAGTIDRAALQPRIDALVAALRQAQPADRTSFEQLHGVLNAGQRAAFVDAVQTRISERVGRFHDHHPLKQWAADLGLTDEQKAQIRAAMPPHTGPMGAWKDAHEHGAKVMAAFKQDRFVMDEVEPARDVAQHVAMATDHFVGLAQAALPVLTPAQRTIAA
jgi:Spy/CpxP family protein refolding chaperone